MRPLLAKKSSSFSLFNRRRAVSDSSARSPPPQSSLPLPSPPLPPGLSPSTPTRSSSLSPLIPGDVDLSPDDEDARSSSESFPSVLDQPSEQHAPLDQLDRSLAMLDSRLASMASLGLLPSARSSVAYAAPLTLDTSPASSDDLSVHYDDAREHLEDGLVPAEMAHMRASSLSAFQLPGVALGFSSDDAGDMFGKNMLWDALGLDAEDVSSESESLSYEAQTSMSGSNGSKHSPTTSTPPPTLLRRKSDVSTASSDSASSAEEISGDIFNLSEFPAFGDLPSFASDRSSPNTSRDGSRPPSTHPGTMTSPGLSGNRASKLMAFPIPPPLSPPSRSLPSPPHVSRPSSVAQSQQYLGSGSLTASPTNESSEGADLGSGLGLGLSGVGFALSGGGSTASSAGETDEGPFALDLSGTPDTCETDREALEEKQALDFDGGELDHDSGEESLVDPEGSSAHGPALSLASEESLSEQSHADVVTYLTREVPSLAAKSATEEPSLVSIFSPPRAVAMDLDSPLLLQSGGFVSRSSSPAMQDSPRDEVPESRPSSRASTPKSPIEIYGASLSQLRMTGDNDIPTWDTLPPSPSMARGLEQREKFLVRSPSPAPKSMSPRSPKSRDGEKTLSRRLSFSVLKRRKSEAALSDLSSPKAKASTETQKTDEERALEKTKKKSRLSLYIPRFGGGGVGASGTVPPTPPLPITLMPSSPAHPLAATTSSVAATESSSSSLDHTPSLDPSSSAFTTSSTFSGTPVSSVSVASSAFLPSPPLSLSASPSPFFTEFDYSSPLPSPSALFDVDRPLALSQFITRPARSSSIFPQTVDFSKRAPTPTMLREREGKVLDVEHATPGAVTPVDVVVFPVALGRTGVPRSAVTTPSSERSPSRPTTEGSEYSDEDDADEDYGEETDEDEVPLGTKPGALSVQKKLRATAPRTKRRQAKRSDPFEFDSKTVPLPSSSTSVPLPNPSSLLPFEGHSLLPHSDTKIIKSPSMPLDPSIANSTLTIDQAFSLPDHAPRPRSTKAATLDSIPLFKRKISNGDLKARPNLTIKTSSSGDLTSGRHSPKSTAPFRQRSGSIAGGPRSPLLVVPSAAVPRLPSVPASIAAPLVEEKIFILDHHKHFPVSLKPTTRCGDVVQIARDQKGLSMGTDAEGGFALFEICRSLGVERPMREYELIVDVMKTWDHESNILVIRRTPLWPVLSNHLRPQPQAPRGAYVQLQVKAGKWAKRFLELRDGAIWHSKSDKGKDATVLCQLTAFEVYFVASHKMEQIKAPKPFVFCMKSLLSRAHYEDASDFAFFISVKTSDELISWIKSITEARNSLLRKREQTVLAAHGVRTTLPMPTPAQTLFANPVDPTRTKSFRTPPAHLAAALAAPSMQPSLSAPAATSAGVLASRPPPALWAAMGEPERQAWLAEAQRDARSTKQSFLSFTSGAPPSLARSHTSTR